jgi:hypothetical protein
MRTVGKRKEPQLAYEASGALLKQGAQFNETVAQLAPSSHMPKGVYRYQSHEAANRHQEDCLVRGMARLAAQRGDAV